MRGYWIGAALAAGFAITLASSLSAQQRQSAPDSNLNAEDQLVAVADGAADARRGGDTGRRTWSRPGQAHRNRRVAGGRHGKIERRDCGVPRRGMQRSVLARIRAISSSP